MNYDIWYNIGIHLDYISVINLFQINLRLNEICRSNHFWSLKVKNDFDTKEKEFSETITEVGKAKEAYIFWAGINGVPIPGAEKYGNLDNLLDKVTKTNNNKLIEYFGRLDQSPLMLENLGKNNNQEMIFKLYNSLYIKYAMIGAMKGEHWDLVKKLAEENFTSLELRDIFRTAVGTGNITLFEYLSTKYYRNSDHDSKLLYYACANNKTYMIIYLLGKGIRNFDDGLAGAAKAGNYDLINTMLGLGATNVNRAMICAAQGGHLDVVLDMVTRGATHRNDLLQAAVTIGNLSIAQKAIDLGAKNYSDALLDAVDNDQLEMVEFLLPKITVDNETIKMAARRGNSRIFNMVKHNINSAYYQDILQSAIGGGNLLIVRELIRLGANPLDPELMDMATDYHQLNSILELVRQGADYQVWIDKMQPGFLRYLSRYND